MSFFKRPGEILDWVDARKEECWFNEDTREKYCIPRPQIEEELGMKMWQRVNTGNLPHAQERHLAGSG